MSLKPVAAKVGPATLAPKFPAMVLEMLQVGTAVGYATMNFVPAGVVTLNARMSEHSRTSVSEAKALEADGLPASVIGVDVGVAVVVAMVG